MDFLFDNFHVLIGIAGAIAYFFNTFRQAKAEERQAREEREQRRQSGDDTDWEMPEPAEWQPDPQDSLPPPLPMPTASPRESSRRQPPLVRAAQAAAPRNLAVPTANEAELQRQRSLQDRLAAIRSQLPAKPILPAAVDRGWVGRKTAAARPAVADAPLRKRLRDRHELRRAIVIREVLGTPLGLR